MSENLRKLNEILRSGSVPFSKPKNPEIDMFSAITYKGEYLKPGIQYALGHMDEVAKLEFEYNFSQPVPTTIEHLNVAKTFIDTYKPKQGVLMDIPMTISLDNNKSISDFLVECYEFSARDPETFTILTESRGPLIKKIFGNDFKGEPEKFELLIKEMETKAKAKPNPTNSLVIQIIFDSSDVESALDTMLINRSDCTEKQWRIGIVFIHESLKDEVFRTLSQQRLNSNNSSTYSKSDYSYIQEKCSDLVKKFGGKMLESDNKLTTLLFDIPWTCYFEEFPPIVDSPVIINFFRTAKEAIQLVKEIPVEKYSIWTENIGLFYEMAAYLNGSFIWSNSVGLFDGAMAAHLYGCEIENSGDSTINKKSKYAVHRLKNEDGTSKFLYIPFGTIFAN